jgi:hypothetical protein
MDFGEPRTGLKYILTDQKQTFDPVGSTCRTPRTASTCDYNNWGWTTMEKRMNGGGKAGSCDGGGGGSLVKQVRREGEQSNKAVTAAVMGYNNCSWSALKYAKDYALHTEQNVVHNLEFSILNCAQYRQSQSLQRKL